MTDAATVLQFKQQAALRAVELVQPGMVVGLGEGRTALLAVRRIGELLQAGALTNILGVAASLRMEAEAQRLGIPLTTLNAHPCIDFTIDGADEVDPRLDLIKGGGGALLREKIIAQATRREVIVVDEAKLVPALGTAWAVPVEVVPFGWRSQYDYLSGLGARVVPRLASVNLKAGEQPAAGPDTPLDALYHTDQGNIILDCHFGPIHDAAALAERIKRRAGVVEHGLFLGLAHEVIVAGPGGVRHLRR
ncbi:MAG: ribose-5-phosphate isomerase RpiA [Aggregatilineales bacterium]